MVQALRKHTPFFSIVAVILLLPTMLRHVVWAWSPVPFTEGAAVESALLRTGIEPLALASAGVTDGEVAGIAANVAEEVATLNALSAADAAWVSAKQDMQELERLVRSGRGSPEDVTAYNAAKSAYESAEATRNSALDAVFAAAVADLDEGEASTLATIRSNMQWELPAHYLVVNRTEAEWVALDRALANERISAERGRGADSACSTLLATVEAEEDIAAATTACGANVASIRTAWATAFP